MRLYLCCGRMLLFDPERREVQLGPMLVFRVKNPVGRRREPNPSQREEQLSETTVSQPRQNKSWHDPSQLDKTLIDFSDLIAAFVPG